MNRPRIASLWVVVIVSMAAATAVHAQPSAFDRGGWIVAGNGSWTHRHDSDLGETINDASLFVNLERFVAPGLAIGLAAESAHRRDKVLAYVSRATVLGVGPAVDAYPGPRSSRLRGHLGASYFFVHETIRVRDAPEVVAFEATDHFRSSDVNLRGGGVFLLGRNVGLGADAFYEHVWNHRSTTTNVGPLSIDDSHQDVYGVLVGLTIFLY